MERAKVNENVPENLRIDAFCFFISNKIMTRAKKMHFLSVNNIGIKCCM